MRTVLASSLPAHGSALLLSLAALACTAAPPPAPPPEADSAALRRQIQALVAKAPCDSDTQCRSIGVGHKACGGPAGYLAWSTRGTDEGALRALVERQARAEREEEQQQQQRQTGAGRLSNCMLEPDPSARCVVAGPQGGQCQLKPN